MCRKGSKLRRLLLLISLMSVLFMVGPEAAGITAASAGELTLAEAFQHGREQNAELIQHREELRSLEAGLSELAAGMGWQLDLSGNASYGSSAAGLMKSYYFAENKDKEAGGLGSISLKMNRSYFSGPQLSGSLSLRETQPFKFEDLGDKYSLDLNLSQRVYPEIPTQLERQYYQMDNQLETGEIQYQSLLRTKETDWLELYLNLRSLEKALLTAVEGYEMTETNLEQVRAEAEIGEKGETGLLAAEIELKAAELNLKKARTGFEQASDKFYQALGLYKTQPGIAGADEYLTGARARAAACSIDYFDLEGLMALVRERNYQLQTLAANIAYKERELEWQEAEDEPQLTASGSYNYNHSIPGDDEWQVSLALSCNLFDSGRQQASIEGLERELSSLKRRKKAMLNELELGLKGLIGQLELDILDRESSELRCEKAVLEAEMAGEQLKEGLITPRQHRQILIREQQALNELAAAEGRVLLSRLRILNYVGL